MSGYGLLQMSQSLKQQGMAGLGDSAKLEQQRNMLNEQMKEQKKTTEKTSMASGAATGAMMGFMMGAGPVGAVVGGAVGLLGGWALS